VSIRDPLGYYRTLNISPGAATEEIVLAYRLLKQAYFERHDSMDIGRIQAAYDTLMDAERRARYDRGGSAPATSVRRRVGTPGVLATLLILLALILGVVLGPVIGYSLTSFEAGDRLFWTEGGEFAGTVQGYEPHHVFPNGAMAPAYLLVGATGESTWYPAGDLVRVAESR
jgi:hypothetical protein